MIQLVNRDGDNPMNHTLRRGYVGIRVTLEDADMMNLLGAVPNISM